MGLGYELVSDYELLTLLKAGDRLAYTEIYNRYKIVLHTHAYKWMRDREEAKDIIHEIFALLWDKRDSLEFDSSLSGYLYVSLRNRIFNRLAKQKFESRYIDSLQEFMDKGDCITDHRVREKQLSELVEKEISELPAKMRLVFELSRKRDLSHKEIAAQLDLSEQTVRKHIQHALRILKSKFSFILFLFFFTP